MPKVNDIVKGKRQNGDIGIELEYEADNLGFTKNYWRFEEDHSLRGNSGEYVLIKPLPYEEAIKALELLSDTFKANNTVVRDTFRAGTHVHINVQELNTKQLINMIVLYVMYERALISLCREDRKGNHFCLRFQDAMGLVKILETVVSKSDLNYLASDTYRYSSLNLTSLFKYGSLEFRSMESTVDFEMLGKWIKVLLQLREASKKFKDPKELLSSASGKGFLSFAKEVFEDSWEFISHAIKEFEVQQGIWEIQSVVYSRDWDAIEHNIFINNNIF